MSLLRPLLAATIIVASATSLAAQQAPSTIADLLKRTADPAKMIASGETKSAALTDANVTLSDSSRVDLWYFRGTAGQRVRVRMRSDDFDTFLHLGQQGGNEPLVQNDDAGDDGVNSAAELTLPEDGVYVILANAYEASGRGAYTVDLVIREPAPGMSGPVTPATVTLREVDPMQRLGVNQRFGSQLDARDAKMDDGTHFEVWYVTATAGDTLQISASSGAFTPALHFGRQGSGSLIAESVGTGAPALRVVVSESGTYAIVLRSAQPASFGSYILEITRNTLP